MKMKLLIYFSFILFFGLLKSQGVGQTAGQFSVSLSGGANYSVPIKNLPGIKDVAPSITLEYSSQSGNGIAGWGWNLNGVSSITRLTSTKFHDGQIDGIDYDNNDRFALDGQRLILKSGVYGEDNAEYQTEIYSNIKIISKGSSTEGPSYFIVYHPDGKVATYGNDNNSKNSFEWKLSQIDDVNSNRIEFSYFKEGTHTIYLSSVKYGGNSAIGQSTQVNEINFYYKNSSRNDQNYIYDSKLVFLTKKLDRIEVKGSGQLFRKYQLTYNTTSLNYDRLIQVQESNASGETIVPIIFEYDTTQNGLTDNSRNITSVSPAYDNATWNYVSGYFDKDGAIDFMTYPGSKDKLYRFNSSQLLNSTSNVAGSVINVAKFSDAFSTKVVLGNNKYYNLDAVTTVLDGTIINSDEEITINSYISNASYNSLDLAFNNTFTFPAAINQRCILINGEDVYYSKIGKKFYSGDFDGDGVSDIIAFSLPYTVSYTYACGGGGLEPSTGIEKKPPTNCCTQSSTIDGSNAYFMKLDPNNSSSQQASIVGYNNVVNSSSKIYVADFNSDGKSDLYVFNNLRIYVYGYENNSLVLLHETANAFYSSDKPVYLADFNGDGKTDIITPDGDGSSNWVILTSTGKGFQMGYINTGITYRKPQVINSCYPNGSGGQLCGYMLQVFYYTFSDINGDGKADVIVHDVLTPYNYPQGGQWNYPYNQYGDNFTIRDKGSIRYNLGSDVNGFPTFSPYIDNWQNNFTSGGATNKGTPIFLNNSGTNNQNLDYAFFGGDKIKFASFKKDNRVDVTLKRIKENEIVTNINYSPLLDNGTNIYTEDQLETYPNVNVNISPSTQLVSRITRSYNGETKVQDYRYKGAVTNLDGIGFLGFKGVATSSVYGGTLNQPLWTVVKQDPLKRGTNVESYLLNGFVDFNSPSNFITKSIKTYNTSLLSNKVFVNLPSVIQQIDNLTGITKFSYLEEYDSYNNVKKSRDVAPGGEKISLYEFDNNPAGVSNQYFIGRPTKKIETHTLGSESFSTEQIYSYSNNLLSQLKRKGHGTDYVIEDYLYDGYGNIIQKTLSAVNMTPRVEKTQFDTSGRFMIKITNISGFEDTFNYDPTFGLLNSKTNYLNQTIAFEYDNWQKKVKEKDIYNNETNFYYEWITSGDYANGIKLRVVDPTGSIAENYSDVWGRKRLERKLSLNNKWIDKKIEYNIQDKPFKSSDPFFSTTTPTRWTITEFDEYNRIKKVNFPTGKVITSAYNGLNVTVSDGQKTQTMTSDAWGNKTKSVDNGETINYTYYPNGVLKMSNYGNHTITIEQDGWGRKTRMSDPTIGGDYVYEYDIFGQMVYEENPKGKTFITYDQFGKIVNKKVIGDATDIDFDYIYNAQGILLAETGTSNGIANSFNYNYDNFYRLSEKTENNGQAIFKKTFTYDNYGRIKNEKTQTIYNSLNSEFEIENHYASCGVLETITDTDGKIIWKLNNLNEKEQVINASLGNGTTITNGFDANYYLHSTLHNNTNTGTVINNVYNFSPITGVLENRNSTVIQGGWQENFEYDNFLRLVAWSDPTTSTSQTYDNFGRINNNSNVGDYKYDGSNRYKKEVINLNSAGDAYYKVHQLQEIEYNAFRMPVSIKQEGNIMASFQYNIHQTRSSSTYDFDKDFFVYQKHKIYSDEKNVEIVNFQSIGKPHPAFVHTRIITYIGGDPYSAPAVFIKDFRVDELTNEGVHYLHRDYQNTILAISDREGNVEERRHFDPWGNLVYLEKNGNIIDLNKISPDLMIERGYTGHEHFFQVGLIHMNGRLYDPKLHTFLSTDNYIQDPFNSQNYNRYGYVLNNPLMFTDPSGDILFVPILIGMAYGAIAGAAIAVVTYSIPALLNGSWNWKGLGTSVMYGAITGAISGGMSAATSQMAGAIWQSSTMNMLTSVASQVGAGVALGDNITWGTIAAGVVSGYLSTKMDPWTGVGKSWIGNAAGELIYTAGTGAIVGGISGTIAASLSGKGFASGLATGMRNGAIGSASQTVAVVGLLGATYEPEADVLNEVKIMSQKSKVGYGNIKWRQGGLIPNLFSSITVGNNVGMNKYDIADPSVYGHEFGHILQQYQGQDKYEGTGHNPKPQGWSVFQARGMFEQWILPIFIKGFDPYHTRKDNGAQYNEYDASQKFDNRNQ